LRAKTKNRISKAIKKYLRLETLSSYWGLLKHGDTKDIKKKILGRIMRDDA